MPRTKTGSKEITGARMWPALADAVNAWMAANGPHSMGNMLRRAIPGLGPQVVWRGGLRGHVAHGDHIDPRVRDDEREAIRAMAEACGMSTFDFVTIAICRLVGTPFLTKAERIARVNQTRKPAAPKPVKRPATCSPLPATDSRWPTGMSGVDDLEAEFARRRAHLEARGDLRDRVEDDARDEQRARFRRKLGMGRAA